MSTTCPHFWNGNLSMALAQAVKNVRSDPRWTEQYMRKIVEEYISSGTPLPESVDSLRREMRR